MQKQGMGKWVVIIVVVALVLGLGVVGYNYVRENNIYAKG